MLEAPGCAPPPPSPLQVLRRRHNCVNTKFKNRKFIFLVLYVDDILLASSDVSLLLETKKFDMKDLGEASFVLGIEIHRDRRKRV